MTKELEDQFRGKTITEKSGRQTTCIGAYVTDAAGLVLVVLWNNNGQATVETLRVVGNSLVVS